MSDKHVLVVLIAGIGDLVLASPALRALKKGHPKATLHLLTSGEAAELAAHYSYLDKVWPFPLRKLRQDKTAYVEIISLLWRMNHFQFDRAVNFYHVDSRAGALKMGAIFLFIRAKEKIGHDRYGFGHFLDTKVSSEFFARHHITDAMTELAAIAGGRTDKGGIEVFWENESKRRFRYLFNNPAVPQGQQDQPLFVGINPGGDRTNRRWVTERYAAVGDKIAATLNARILIFGGPGEEHIAGRIQDKMTSEVVNLAGKLSINDLAYVISRLDLLITNDSGPMHIAAATRTPVVAIFGPEDPVLMKPYTSEDLYRVMSKPLPCRPCQQDHCARPLCLDAISPEEVFNSCMELLGSLGKIKPNNI